MTADLHSHTHYSDGTLSPAELVQLARERKLDVVAISDHDTMNGIPEGLEAGKNFGVRVIPAVEVTAQFHDQEMHILGYFPDDNHWQNSEFQNMLKQFRQIRLERAAKTVAKLKEAGVSLELNDVLKLAGKGSVGRPHIARALLASGQIQTFDEAFSRFISQGKPAWVDKYRVGSDEAIRLIHCAGGLAVLAHPGLLKNEQIPAALCNQGLDGVEVYHSKHDSKLSRRYLQWAQKHELLSTGGSDCHGSARNAPILGSVRLDSVLLKNFLRRLGSATQNPV